LFCISISLILEILSPANFLRIVLRIFQIIREEIIVETFKTANTLIVSLLYFV